MNRLMIAAAVIATCLSRSAGATVITGTIVAATGDRVSGQCSYQSVTEFVSATNYEVSGTPVTVPFNAGNLRVTLIPTTTGIPTPQYYLVRCQVPSQIVNGRQISAYQWGPQFWLVPDSSTPLPVNTVVVAVSPTPTTNLPDGSYCIDVANGALAGALVPCSSGAPTGTVMFWTQNMSWNGSPMRWR
jgi:hypothetical protein